jgi:hypothetical protein
VLELAARAHRRPTALLAPLGSSEAHAFACCHPLCPLAGFPRAAVATAEPRRWPPLCLHSGHLPLLGEHVVVLSRLPGRQRRQLAGAGLPAPPGRPRAGLL